MKIREEKDNRLEEERRKENNSNKKTKITTKTKNFHIPQSPLHLSLSSTLNPKISLIILLTVCYTIYVMLVWRIWNWINHMIFFFILITCLLDIVPILSGEILSRSLVGLKGLTKRCSSYQDYNPTR